MMDFCSTDVQVYAQGAIVGVAVAVDDEVPEAVELGIVVEVHVLSDAL